MLLIGKKFFRIFSRNVRSFAYFQIWNFTYIYEALKRYEDVFYLPQATKGSDPSWFGFPLTIRPGAPFSRAEIVEFLEDRKVMTRYLFTGNILRQPAYENIECRVIGDLAQSEYVGENTFWVGLYPGLTTAMIDYMLEMFNEFLQR